MTTNEELRAALDTIIKAASDRHGLPHAWDIITALRGPDTDIHNSLKELTTCRLRGILGLDEGSRYAISAPSPLDEREIRYRNYLLDTHNKQFGSHFLNHFTCAMESAKALGYNVPDAELDFHCDEPQSEAATL
jgi:hypothetical protein